MTNRKILVIHQGAIGDLVLSLPAVTGLQKHFQHHTFFFMGYPSILELIPVQREQVVTIQIPGFSSFYTREPTPPEELKQYLGQFEKVFVFGVKGEEVLTEGMKIIGVKDVVRIDTFPAQGIHVIDYQAAILSSMGIFVENRVPCLFLRDEDEKQADEVLRCQGLRRDKPLICIHPGSGSTKKIWPLSSCARLARHLQSAFSAGIIIIEGPADWIQSETLYAELKREYTVRIKHVSLRVLAALIKRGDCFIGNDSGITHLSAAAGAPTVALFGPTNPAVWGPRGDNVHIIFGKADCSPCNSELLEACTKQICLENISEEVVYHTIEKIINEG